MAEETNVHAARQTLHFSPAQGQPMLDRSQTKSLLRLKSRELEILCALLE